jgi:hypothetical protein
MGLVDPMTHASGSAVCPMGGRVGSGVEEREDGGWLSLLFGFESGFFFFS